MIKTVGLIRIQEPEPGNILTDGINYSKLVYLGDGSLPWQEVIDDGQLESLEVEVIQ